MRPSHTIRPLSSDLGVEVIGINPAGITSADAEIVRQLWLKHHVVVIRGYQISEQQMIDFGHYFGQIEKARKFSPLASHEEIMVISNIRENGQLLGSLPDGELYWHFDRTHQPIPNKAGILYAVELPSTGGETRFANMCAAYAALPDAIRNRIEGLTALNTYQYGQTRAEDKLLSDETPSAIHPVVRTIPETGQKALYVNRLMTDRIIELPEAESKRLLNQLFDHAEQDQFVYEHTWQPDDLLIWDNRCVMHARNDFDGSQRRLLKRLTIADSISPHA